MDNNKNQLRQLYDLILLRIDRFTDAYKIHNIICCLRSNVAFYCDYVLAINSYIIKILSVYYRIMYIILLFFLSNLELRNYRLNESISRVLHVEDAYI